MTRDEVIKMAREAGAEFAELPMTDAIVFSVEDRAWNSAALHRFAALVAAERDKDIKRLAKALKQAQKVNDELISVMSGSTEIAVRLAVKAEREECAKVCDDWPNGRDDVDSIAAAIRSRT